MSNMNHMRLFHTLFIVLCSSLGLCQETTHGTVIARVNGKALYETQISSEVEQSLAKFRKYGMRQEDPNLVKRLEKKALNKKIGDELLYQESRKRTIPDIDRKVDIQLKILQKKYGHGTHWENYLRVRNLTMDKLRESLQAKIYVDDYLKHKGILEPEIPEERIRQVYNDHPDRYTREESVNVSHILIALDADANAKQTEFTRQKASRIRQEILDGSDFAEMAKTHSDCNSAPGGGHLGFIKKGYMPRAFERVAFSIEPGTVSKVVKTEFGYHILKVHDKREAGRIPYEEVKDFIKKYLQAEESKKKLATHIAELKHKARIEILIPD